MDIRLYQHELHVVCIFSLLTFLRLQHPTSGREIEVYTTEPGLQCYTGCHMKTMTGKGGSTYRQFGAVCLETQHYPNSVNQVQDHVLNQPSTDSFTKKQNKTKTKQNKNFTFNNIT